MRIDATASTRWTICSVERSMKAVKSLDRVMQFFIGTCKCQLLKQSLLLVQLLLSDGREVVLRMAIVCRRSIVPLPTNLHMDGEQRASLEKRGTRCVWNGCSPCSAQCWVAKHSRTLPCYRCRVLQDHVTSAVQGLQRKLHGGMPSNMNLPNLDHDW